MMEEEEKFQGIVTKKGLEYHVTYPADHEWKLVEIKFSDFDRTRDGVEKAEVEVTYQGRSVHFPSRVSINVATGQQSVKSSADRCAQSEPNIKWGTLLEEACKNVRKEQRKGNPVKNLKHGHISEATQYILHPFLIHQQSNLLYGDGGLGKSWFALYLGALVASGKRHGGLTPEPGNVMYIDYEVDQQDMENRFIALCNGLGIEPPDFFYRKQEISMTQDQPRMAQLVAEHNIQFLIIDSAAMACGGEPEAANVASRYWNALRTLNCTTLTLAHVSKTEASEKGTSTPYGSVFWRNYARNAWEIKMGTVFKRLEKEFGLVQTKLNSGAGDDPRNFLFTFDDGTLATKVTVQESLVENNDSLTSTAGPSALITRYILEQRKIAINEGRWFDGVSSVDIAAEYGKTNNSIAVAMTRLKELGIVVALNRGKWDLKVEYDKDEKIMKGETF